MRSLTLDIGNTRCKAAVFVDGRLAERSLVEGGRWPAADRAIACVTGAMPDNLPPDCLVADSRLSLPIALDYATPETLGADRLAAACGAWCKYGPSVIVDAGTCITVDYVDADGVYRGGAILPGLQMKFEALHNFTARLPLLNITEVENEVPLVGRSTKASIESGVVMAARLALEGYVRRIQDAAGRELKVVATGGDAEQICGDWPVDEDLVMQGLYEILRRN